jgi:HEAT repeat protein
MTAHELVRALGAKDWGVRQAAVAGLAGRDGPETVGAVLRAMRDGHQDLGVLNAAIQVLAQTGVDTTSALREFLTGADSDLRAYAAIVLGAQNSATAIPDLMGALDDPDANVRYQVIEALGNLRAGAAVDALTALAESRDFHLAFPALAALGVIGDSRIAHRLVQLLEDRFLQAAAVEALGQLGDEEMVGVLAALLNDGGPAGVVAQALAALYRRHEDAYREGDYIAQLARRAITATGVRNLIASLDRTAGGEIEAQALVLGWLEGPEADQTLAALLDIPTVREEAAEALVRRGARVTGLLIDRLGAEDNGARRAAILALGRIGDKQAAPALLSILQPEHGLTVPVAGALAMIGDARAYSALVGLLGYPNASVRQAVVSALNAIGHPDMAADLIALLVDNDPLVRESAVRIAGYFGFPECADLLMERCHDPAQNVRRAAVECLWRLEDARKTAVLLESLRDESPLVRAAAVRGLEQVNSPDAWNGVRSALDDPDPWARYFAARSAGRHGAPLALAVLRRLAQEDNAMQVRVAAVEAIGRAGDPADIAILAPLSVAADDDLARTALAALGALAHPDALPALVAASGTRASARRAQAVSALGRSGLEQAAEILNRAAAGPDPLVAQAAIDALGQLATPAAVDALVALTAIPSRRDACIVALAGLGELGELGEKQAAWVARGLRNEHLDVRRAVVAALARMKHAAADEQLRNALDEAEGSVRFAIIAALAHSGRQNRR